MSKRCDTKFWQKENFNKGQKISYLHVRQNNQFNELFEAVLGIRAKNAEVFWTILLFQLEIWIVG